MTEPTLTPPSRKKKAVPIQNGVFPGMGGAGILVLLVLFLAVGFFYQQNRSNKTLDRLQSDLSGQITALSQTLDAIKTDTQEQLRGPEIRVEEREEGALATILPSGLDAAGFTLAFPTSWGLVSVERLSSSDEVPAYLVRYVFAPEGPNKEGKKLILGIEETGPVETAEDLTRRQEEPTIAAFDARYTYTRVPIVGCEASEDGCSEQMSKVSEESASIAKTIVLIGDRPEVVVPVDSGEPTAP